ncbi:MAG: GxxExxY protein [Paludibacteraceae bacterium]|nr:GxxExxY protein [Paludibacteraceae bacterium]
MTSFLQYNELVYRIIGAAMTVHSELKWGLLEPIYQEALHLELMDQSIDNERECEISCYYKTHCLTKTYKMDIVVKDIILELKSCKEIIPSHRAQLFNYLRLTKHPIGLLINFGSHTLQCERYGYDDATNECYLLDRHMQIVPKEPKWSETE